MLKKKLGTRAIEGTWSWRTNLKKFFKIPSTLIIPEGIKEIGQFAFYNCRLKKVVIPESVKYIGPGAFEWCKNLRKVEIPESVEKIGYEAFMDCKNATIILRRRKEDFEKIGSYAFWKCKDVKEEIRS